MDAMNYFRSVSLAEEYSDRSLGLTKHCIMLNAANYTVWYFRRKILFSMENVSQLLQEECTWLNEMILVHPKNYQIWHHRKEIVSKSQVYENELDFSAKALSDDSKNYHAWAYRQWLYKTFKKLPFEVEMQYTDYLLEKDVLNNSAWNQRWFISHLSNSPNFEQSEVEYALAKIDKCVDNEAVWNYLLAYLRQRTLDKKVYLDIQRRLETQWLTALDNRHVLYFAIVLYSELKSFMDAPRDCTPVIIFFIRFSYNFSHILHF